MSAFRLLKTLREKVDPRESLVVVIDMQNDFLAEGGFAEQVGWPLAGNQRAAKRLEAFLSEARKASVPVVFVRSTYDDVYLSNPMRERNERRKLDKPRCIAGTWGADFYAVRPQRGEPVVVKHRYSAFAETDLRTVVRGLGAQTLILTGVYTEVCVEATARDGYFLDFYVVMVEDCCGTTTDAAHQGALARCERDFGVAASSAEITATWQRLMESA